MRNKLIKHCKLYKGEATNPYTDILSSSKGEAWHTAYLKFNIWDAEYSVSNNPQWWIDMWEHTFKIKMPKENQSEELYKFCISDKLKKLETNNIDYYAMYFQLD